MKTHPKRLARLSVLLLTGLTATLMVTPSSSQNECEGEVCFSETSDLPQAITSPVDNPPKQISTETFTSEQKALVDGITADLKARRLMRPKGNNALQKIRELREILPTHDYSVNGETYISRVYMVLGRAAIKNGQTDLALQRLQSAVRLNKNVKGQQALQEAIVDATERSGEGSTSKSVIENYADASRKIEKLPSESPRMDSIEFVAPVMVAIPAGKFVMGSEAGAEDEKPMREVSIEAFSMSKHEITMEQYRVYAIDNNLLVPQFKADEYNRPVTNISWHDAKGYTQWLSVRTGKNYRLPSEAQWEYAARAGTVTPFYSGEELLNVANCAGCESELGGVSTTPVGSFSPNEYGLYDMHGNVWEWVEDCWTDNYFGRGDNAAAVFIQGCKRHVMRGGSWYNEADFARSSYRGNEVPSFRDRTVGFRVIHDGL